jgi:hypothetical protein
MTVLLLPFVTLILTQSCKVTAFVAPCITTAAPPTHVIRNRWTVQMFTGIVEEMGVVQSLVERDDMPLWDGSMGTGTELTVQGNVVLDGAYLG